MPELPPASTLTTDSDRTGQYPLPSMTPEPSGAENAPPSTNADQPGQCVLLSKTSEPSEVEHATDQYCKFCLELHDAYDARIPDHAKPQNPGDPSRFSQGRVMGVTWTKSCPACKVFEMVTAAASKEGRSDYDIADLFVERAIKRLRLEASDEEEWKHSMPNVDLLVYNDPGELQ